MQTWREKDLEILPFLSNVHVSRKLEPKTLIIKLSFKENEFFNNESLTTTIIYKEDEDDEV